jgi:hypothetical protein
VKVLKCPACKSEREGGPFLAKSMTTYCPRCFWGIIHQARADHSEEKNISRLRKAHS